MDERKQLSDFRHFLLNKMFVLKMSIAEIFEVRGDGGDDDGSGNARGESDNVEGETVKRLLDKIILLVQYEKVFLGEKLDLYKLSESLKKIIEFAVVGIPENAYLNISISGDDFDILADKNIFIDAVKCILFGIVFSGGDSYEKIDFVLNKDNRELKIVLDKPIPELFGRTGLNYSDDDASSTAVYVQILRAIIEEHGFMLHCAGNELVMRF